MKESKLSTDFTLKGPQISVWIISKTPVLWFAPFLIFFVYFPLMQSVQCSTSASEKSKGRRIFSLMRRSILPLEIWRHSIFRSRGDTKTRWRESFGQHAHHVGE